MFIFSSVHSMRCHSTLSCNVLESLGIGTVPVETNVCQQFVVYYPVVDVQAVLVHERWLKL